MLPMQYCSETEPIQLVQPAGPVVRMEIWPWHGVGRGNSECGVLIMTAVGLLMLGRRLRTCCACRTRSRRGARTSRVAARTRVGLKCLLESRAGCRCGALLLRIRRHGNNNPHTHVCNCSAVQLNPGLLPRCSMAALTMGSMLARAAGRLGFP